MAWSGQAEAGRARCVKGTAATPIVGALPLLSAWQKVHMCCCQVVHVWIHDRCVCVLQKDGTRCPCTCFACCFRLNSLRRKGSAAALPCLFFLFMPHTGHGLSLSGVSGFGAFHWNCRVFHCLLIFAPLSNDPGKMGSASGRLAFQLVNSVRR